MTPEQLNVARVGVCRRWVGGGFEPFANVVKCGRRHPHHSVWLSMVDAGLAQMIAPTFGEPERFQLTQDGLDAVLAANGAKPS